MTDFLKLRPGDLVFENAMIARRVVATFGGRITFADYDKAMFVERYFIPLEWVAGWGDATLHKTNSDKMCAFAAVQIGLLTSLENGYALGLRVEDIF